MPTREDRRLMKEFEEVYIRVNNDPDFTPEDVLHMEDLLDDLKERGYVVTDRRVPVITKGNE